MFKLVQLEGGINRTDTTTDTCRRWQGRLDDVVKDTLTCPRHATTFYLQRGVATRNAVASPTAPLIPTIGPWKASSPPI